MFSIFIHATYCLPVHIPLDLSPAVPVSKWSWPPCPWCRTTRRGAPWRHCETPRGTRRHLKLPKGSWSVDLHHLGCHTLLKQICWNWKKSIIILFLCSDQIVLPNLSNTSMTRISTLSSSGNHTMRESEDVMNCGKWTSHSLLVSWRLLQSNSPV